MLQSQSSNAMRNMSSSYSQKRKQVKLTHEVAESVSMSIGVLYALTLTIAMALQYMSYEDQMQEKNMLLLMCARKEFRSFVVQTMKDPSDGDVGKYQKEMFNFTKNMGEGKILDLEKVLTDDRFWPEPGGKPDVIYTCGEKPEVAATVHIIAGDFPMRLMGAWALMNPDAPLWSDHIAAMASFGMSVIKAGLLGSLFIYLSIAMTPGRGEETGLEISSWAKIGLPVLVINFLVLIAGVIILLFAQDAHVESLDAFFLRAGRWGAYSKLGMLCVFVPIAFAQLILSIVATYQGGRASAENDKTYDAGKETE